MQWLTLVSSQQEGRGLDPQPKGLAEWSLHELSRCSPPSSHSPKKKTCMCGDLETQIVRRCECRCEMSELSFRVTLDTYCGGQAKI